MAKRVKDEERLYFEMIIGEWSDDGGILINRFPEEKKTLLAWVGDSGDQWRSARTGTFKGQSFTARCTLVG